MNIFEEVRVALLNAQLLDRTNNQGGLSILWYDQEILVFSKPMTG